MKKLTNYIKKLAPWIIALGIFLYLFHIYPPEKVWQALKYVNLPAFAAFAVAYFLFLYFIDSLVMQKVITRFSHPVEFGSILAARGATYLIMILNYPASQAAFAYYLKRRYGIAIFEALGIFLFIVFIDLIWLITLALAGSFFQEYSVAGVDLGATIQTIAVIAYASTFVWLAFWRRLPERIIGRHIKIPIIEGLRNRRVFHIFNQATAIDYLKVAAMRTPIHLTIIVFMYVVLLTFHTSIPFVKVLGNVPVVFLIGTLPITPGGLGTVNAAMVELLYPYLSGSIFADGKITPKEILFTATLLWMFSNYLMKAILGTILFRGISKDLFKPTRDVPEEKAEHEAAHIRGNI